MGSAGEVLDDRVQAVPARRDHEPITGFNRSMPVVLREPWRVVTCDGHDRGF